MYFERIFRTANINYYSEIIYNNGESTYHEQFEIKFEFWNCFYNDDNF